MSKNTTTRPVSVAATRDAANESFDDEEDDGIDYEPALAAVDDLASMETTKTDLYQRLALPPEMIDVLQWHVVNVLLPSKMRMSELLFPSVLGGFRSRSCLDKPFAEVATAIKLPFSFTPRGMRRTYQDLARAAGIHDAVTRAISGHATVEMQMHYSTVRSNEVRSALKQMSAVRRGEARPHAAFVWNRDVDELVGLRIDRCIPFPISLIDADSDEHCTHIAMVCAHECRCRVEPGRDTCRSPPTASPMSPGLGGGPPKLSKLTPSPAPPRQGAPQGGRSTTPQRVPARCATRSAA